MLTKLKKKNNRTMHALLKRNFIKEVKTQDFDKHNNNGQLATFGVRDSQTDNSSQCAMGWGPGQMAKLLVRCRCRRRHLEIQIDIQGIAMSSV